MSFLDPSDFSNNKIVKGLPIGGGSANLYIDGVNYNPVNTELLTRRIFAQDDTVSTAAGGLGAGAIPANLIDQVNKGQTAVGNFVRSTIQSSLNTLGKAATSLSSGISGQLSSIFQNTNDPKASTVSTKISDPISTNLLSNKKPEGTAFKVDGLVAGSQSIDNASTRIGTGSSLMTGTSLTTLANRFRMEIDAIKGLPGTIRNSFSSQRLGGLFGNSTLAGAGSVAGRLNNSLSGAPLSSVLVGALGSALGLKTGLTISTSDINGLQSFFGRTSTVSKTLGIDLGGYYQTNPNYSVMDQNGVPLYTNRSGVDADTANSILGLVSQTACAIRVSEYRSVNETGSLFGVGLILAALHGLTGLVDDLLNCDQSQTYLGQQSLGRAFGEVSGSQIDIAKSIIDKVEVPTKLNTPDLSISILSNPNLKSTDATTVNNVFAALGTDTKSAMMLPQFSSSQYPVYDASIVPRIQTGFADAIFKDSTLTDYFAGRPAVVGFDGNLVYI